MDTFVYNALPTLNGFLWMEYLIRIIMLKVIIYYGSWKT